MKCVLKIIIFYLLKKNKYLLKHFKNTKILHVLNGLMVIDNHINSSAHVQCATDNTVFYK